MNIEDIKTWKGAVEFTAYKYSTAKRQWASDACGFCRVSNKRDEECPDCPVLPEPKNQGCDSFWNCYLSRARVHEIFTAVLAKVSIFSARNIRAALIKEFIPRERKIFIKDN